MKTTFEVGFQAITFEDLDKDSNMEIAIKNGNTYEHILLNANYIVLLREHLNNVCEVLKANKSDKLSIT